ETVKTTGAASIRVLLVDDHPVVRDGLRMYLSKRPGIDVVGEGGDGLSAVELCRQLRPDVVLMDLAMPGMNGLEAISHIRMVSPATRVLILTMQEDREYLREARRHGASGYLVKDAGPAELATAIGAVHAGDPFYAIGTSQALVQELSREARSETPKTPEPALSPRERQVLSMLAEGKGSREIAAQLGLGLRTVESHRLRLRKKLGIRSVAGLTRYALEHGFGPPVGR
ncbi:MAG TPA: response regulator transcription factor, partial [Planctomycetota bacterium]|nr:response regulator transcription factor [Planctomycetota bacterium]